LFVLNGFLVTVTNMAPTEDGKESGDTGQVRIRMESRPFRQGRNLRNRAGTGRSAWFSV